MESVIEVLLFFIAVILSYVAVVLTVQVKALKRQVDSYDKQVDSYGKLERFLVEWLGDFQKERQAGSLETAAGTRALRKTALLFLKMVHFPPTHGSTYSDSDLKTLLAGVQDQDERLTG